MDPMLEQIALRGREMQKQQRDIVADLTRDFCERHGGSPEQLAEAAGLDVGRFGGYLENRVSELTADEVSSFMALCSKLNKAKARK